MGTGIDYGTAVGLGLAIGMGVCGILMAVNGMGVCGILMAVNDLVIAFSNALTTGAWMLSDLIQAYPILVVPLIAVEVGIMLLLFVYMVQPGVDALTEFLCDVSPPAGEVAADGTPADGVAEAVARWRAWARPRGRLRKYLAEAAADRRRQRRDALLRVGSAADARRRALVTGLLAFHENRMGDQYRRWAKDRRTIGAADRDDDCRAVAPGMPPPLNEDEKFSMLYSIAELMRANRDATAMRGAWAALRAQNPCRRVRFEPLDPAVGVFTWDDPPADEDDDDDDDDDEGLQGKTQASRPRWGQGGLLSTWSGGCSVPRGAAVTKTP
jgi:hypothetical protein